MEQIDKYTKIPCPNCANKIIAMINSVDVGTEIYKCQICKALVTYSHTDNKVIDIKKYVRKPKDVFKGDNSSK